MNQNSLDKIRSSAKFILWFRSVLPSEIQQIIRPYLDQPYRLALNILDCCDRDNAITIDAIAQETSLNRETTRQVLKALESGGMKFNVSRARSWQILDFDSQPIVDNKEKLTEELRLETSLNQN
ncbi:hypothetical protein [Calothrix sp. UHCC 0171]|uniref:hypothetical protein n=1 Tax=Calothrix sp. UHCC 0171 TaxID=3110245 RepID=UPI002B1F10D8|nr:hypothetical protein [Calothrix sp. UHCC 0171]MEA5569673.1 hypothetical protein [Calothrix sp. UHCC 0171]